MILDIQPASTRLRVAAIVWWNYFSHRHASSPWTHLDDMAFAPSWDLHNKPRVKKALVALGFEESDAENKATLPKGYPPPSGASNKSKLEPEELINGLL